VRGRGRRGCARGGEGEGGTLSKYLHHPHSLVLLPVAVTRKVALQSAWSPRAPSAVCSSHCSVDAQPGRRGIQVCTAVRARALVIISFIIGLSGREKQGRGAREERWEEGGKREGKGKGKRTLIIIARAAAAGNRGIHPLLSLGLGRGRENAKHKVAERISISDARPQNTQWGGRESGDSGEQTQTERGANINAKNRRGEGSASGAPARA
jgi:hypothetical protein